MADGELLDSQRVEMLRTLPSGQDNLFETLVGLFVTEAEQVMAGIAAAEESREYTTVENLAHRLKSSSGQLGAGMLARECARLEQVCQQAGVADEAVSEACSEVRDILAKTLDRLRAVAGLA